ncbi:SSI family serine proteinase inhibitor [Streptomyces sp. NPDC051776]|uniref:SSI family serine proteinase inhibitor n=1 Tax=Streptomyces sp. NPDC051776 TaxID=3155414 RepID=UPI003412DD9E
MLLRRLALVTLTAAAALAAAPAAGAAAAPMPHPMPLPLLGSFMPPPSVAPAGEDRLTITISNSGNRAVDGRYSLDCHPTGGTHSQARAACDRLDEMTRWGEDPFGPGEPRGNCTMMYGGPTTARITGTWAGRPVDARFDRHDGCAIARWNRLRPVLPEAGV